MSTNKIGIILGYYTFITFLSFGFFYYYSVGSIILLINNTTTSFVVLAITHFVKKEKLNQNLFSHLLVSITFIPLIILNLVLGGIDSPMNYWFLATILGAGFLLKAKWMFLWGMNVLLVYIFFMLMKLQSIGFDFQITLSESDHLLYHFVGLIGVMALILLGSFSYIQVSKQYSKELKASFERNNMLIKILNHDLANSFTIIDVYSKTLDESTIEKAKPKLLRANQSIADILSSIRSINRFQTIAPKLKEEKLKEMIEEILPEVKELFAGKNISYNIDVDEDIQVYIDAGIFQHIIIKNLLTNASKFSHENSEISIVFFDNKLSIIDQGVGIPKSMIKDLFEYDKSTTPRTGTHGELGAGFGLPLVKDCCDKMSIKIDVLSNDSGTTINLSFQGN